MKRVSYPLFALAALMLAACQTSSLTRAEREPVPESDVEFSGELRSIDKAQSVILFVGKSNLIDHEGKFTEYSADIELDLQDPADLEKASITATIDIATLEVDSDGLKGHLMRDDFFDVETYPTIMFASTSIARVEGNTYDVTGDLTVKGVTQSVSFEAEITDEYLTAHYDFPRAAFGVGNESYGEKLLDETVSVEVKLVFRS